MASYIIVTIFVIFVIYSSSRKRGGKGKGRRRSTLGPTGFIFLGGRSFGSGGSGASSGW